MISKGKVLVTGASGFLGRRVVEILIKENYSVRALVRKSSRIGHLDDLGADISIGDVTDAKSMEPAFEGIDFVVHAAADTSGTEQGARLVTIQGTRNILDLCSSRQVKKLLYISSCSVYSPVDFKDGQIVDENATLEPFPERRGIYSWAKLEAEKFVLDYMNQNKVSAVCLRPGTIYGPGGENFSPMMGFSWGNKIFAVIHKQGFFIPTVYIDNLVYAIISAMVQDKSKGHVYNVIDAQKVRTKQDMVDKKKYMDTFIRKLYPGAWIVYVPFSWLSAAVWCQEKVFRVLMRDPILTQYRLISSQRSIIYDASKIMQHLGWQPTFSFEKAVERILEYEKNKKD